MHLLIVFNHDDGVIIYQQQHIILAKQVQCKDILFILLFLANIKKFKYSALWIANLTNRAYRSYIYASI